MLDFLLGKKPHVANETVFPTTVCRCWVFKCLLKCLQLILPVSLVVVGTGVTVAHGNSDLGGGKPQ